MITFGDHDPHIPLIAGQIYRCVLYRAGRGAVSCRDHFWSELHFFQKNRNCKLAFSHITFLLGGSILYEHRKAHTHYHSENINERFYHLFFCSMAGGVFYREFTKLFDFTGKTTLGVIHGHLLVLEHFSFFFLQCSANLLHLETKNCSKNFFSSITLHSL